MRTELLVVTASFRIKNGEEERFKELLLRLGVEACLAAEPGCLLLSPHQDPQDPCRFFLYEQWSGQAAFEASFDSPWRHEYMTATEHLWAEPRVTRTWALIGSQPTARQDPGTGR